MILPEQLIAIEGAALEAVGRPEMRCQVAMADIYKRAGCLPQDLVIPSGDRDWARAQGVSLISPFVDGCGFFEEVPQPAQAGDLLGFRLGRVLHHVAIQLSGGRMVHVYGGHGVRIAESIPTEWAKRIEKVWRLKA